MLAAAQDRFVASGYTATTMERVAKDAHVAVQTLYYSFRTKGQLLVAVIEYAAAGEVDPQPVMQRSWVRTALAFDSGHEVLKLMVDNGTAIYRGVAPLADAIQEALGEPAVAAHWTATATGRRNGMSRLIAHIDSLGQLARTVERATDITFALAGHETYRSLVGRAGWPEDEYRRWLLDLLSIQLLTDNRH